MIFSGFKFWRAVRPLSPKPKRLLQPNRANSGPAQLASHPLSADLDSAVAPQVLRELDIFHVTLSCLTEPLMTLDFSERLGLLKTFSVPVTEMVTN
jgi:hypothetical protein